MSATTSDEHIAAPVPPHGDCDVVMKGGITSGVIYPTALAEIATNYRIRGIGGTSAGAIGAAIGAAAEYARGSGGYQRLEILPGQLGGGNLAALFQPQKPTRGLLRLMLTAANSDRPGPPRPAWRKIAALLAVTAGAFKIASIVGAAPGIVLIAIGATDDPPDWILVGAGVVIVVVGWLVAMLAGVYLAFSRRIPDNLFGICRGLGSAPDKPGFTDWLTDRIDDTAGLTPEQGPLTFGHLWDPQPGDPAPDGERRVDLRMIATCVTEGRPYEMPWEARRFFFDPAEWRTLFPERVVAALQNAPVPTPPNPADTDDWRWEEDAARTHQPPLHRLPDPRHLPVVVATRLSLSFPLLISAIPMWTIDRRHPHTRQAVQQRRAGVPAGTEPRGPRLQFERSWFTDGGFCSNFPVHLFDAALPSRPTFAINLGRFPDDNDVSPDQSDNIEWARNNRALLPTTTAIPARGVGAIAAFASAAINTSRNWQDSSHLDQPGYRDRIVRVLQTKQEGGLNLYMDGPTIDRLAGRGRTAARTLVEQFTQPRYPEKAPVATGWDNHRWVRYRALLCALPDWLQSYQQGHAVLDINPAAPPSYRLTVDERGLATRITTELTKVATAISDADPGTLEKLTSAPRPGGILRRIPQI